MVSCTLPCHQWKEYLEDGKRVVEEELSGLVYGSGDSDAVITQKLAILALSTIPIVLPIRLATRFALFVTGSWICVGYEKTQLVWNQRCFEWHNQGRLNLPPSLFEYYQILIQNIGSELVDQVIKGISLPFAAIASTFVTLIGVVCPLDGRKLYSGIERVWSISLPEWLTDHATMRFCNYIASCMQPLSVFKEQHLFRFYPPPANQKLSEIYALERLENEGFITLGDLLQTWKSAVKQKPDIDDRGGLRNLIDTCNALNGLIVSHAPQDAITTCQTRKQDTIDTLTQLLKLSVSE